MGPSRCLRRRSCRRRRAPSASSCPPSFVRNTPRSAFGPYGWPMAATYTTSGFVGSIRIRPIWLLSASPMWVQVLPASVRFVDAVTGRDISAKACFAHADVHDVGIRRRDGNRADRTGAEEAVGDVVPRDPGVLGLPDAAAGGAHVVHERLGGHACDSRHAAATVRPDAAPAECAVQTAARLTENRRSAPGDGDRNV